MFSGFMPAFHFKVLGVDYQTSVRLRGGGYRVYSSENAPKDKSRRWLRHWLLAHSPSGIRPYPLDLWLTLPEMGCVDPYRYGGVYSLDRVAPRDFNIKSLDNIRASFDGDDEMFEYLLLLSPMGERAFELSSLVCYG